MGYGGAYSRIWWKYLVYTIAAAVFIVLIVFLRQSDTEFTGQPENADIAPAENVGAPVESVVLTEPEARDKPSLVENKPLAAESPKNDVREEKVDPKAGNPDDHNDTLAPAGTSIEQKQKDFLETLLKYRSETGQDNALIYYEQASRSEIPKPDGNLLDATLKNGWTGNSDELLKYLAMYEPVFELIRNGLAVDFSIFPYPGLDGEETPVPDSNSAIYSAKMLCAQAMYYETLGEYDATLDSYFAALKMGTDYGAENALVKTAEVSVTVKMLVCGQIKNLVMSGRLNSAQLNDVDDVFGKTADEAQPLSYYITNDRIAMTATLNSFVEHLRSLSPEKDAEELKSIKQFSGLDDEKFNNLINNPEVISTWISGFYDDAALFFSRDSWDHYYSSWEEEMNWWNEKSPISEPIALDYAGIDNRFIVCEAWMALIRAAAGLEIYRLDQGLYPERLESAVSMDVYDPFTGQALGYALTESGYVLYSLGPDRENQGAQMEYSIYSGYTGRGDIIIGK